ncbi:MAG: EthD family reductase [Proteobacteria bacterium]|nr:EthD family reductase [Pseudomonadota bacterium]
MIKRISLLTRKAHLTHDEFVRHWLHVHGPLARLVPGIRRYVQSHIKGESVRADIPAAEMEIDGIAELWYDSVEEMKHSSATPEAQALYADGALIIGRIKTFVIEEKVIIE